VPDESDGVRLGIDFGTATTVAVLGGPDGRVRPLLFDSSPLLPSAVFAAPGGDLLTGADAERAAIAQPAGLEANPKRRIDDGTVWLGEQERRVVDLIAAVLLRVAGEARRVAGEPPRAVVLTHPASWGRTRLGVLAQAAAEAGLGEVGLVPEPVAAAVYFATVLGRRIPDDRCLVVYDLGAGTFDISVVRPSLAGFEVVATAGLDDVGGLDLDAAVVGHARGLTASAGEAWGRLDWPQTPADRQARHSLWRGARAAKEQLSRHAATDLHVPLLDTEVHLTREEFEKIARPHLDRTAALTLTVLRDAGIPREQIGGVFLVGGSSRIPLAATLLHRTLGIPPAALDHPELVVAEGSLHGRPSATARPPEPAYPEAPVAQPKYRGMAAIAPPALLPEPVTPTATPSAAAADAAPERPPTAPTAKPPHHLYKPQPSTGPAE
jgi:molecular chaperone DnaK (HSP70)